LELLEIITGCETENRYNIYPACPSGEKFGPAIFHARERSGWCARNCLAGNCRPFEITISHVNLYDPHG